MNKTFSENVEEKFIFNISRLFFLVLSIIALIGVIVSIFIIVWGFTPTTKRQVVKQAIKPLDVVTLDNVIKLVEVEKSKANDSETEETPTKKDKTKKAKKEETKVDKKPTPEDPDKARHKELLEQIKSLIPAKYSWEGKGHFEYPYGINLYVYTRDPRARKYVVDSRGIKENIENMFIDDPNYKVKNQRIEQLLSILKEIPLDDRVIAIKIFTNETKNKIIDHKKDLEKSEQAYESEIERAEKDYNETLFKKSTLKNQAIIMVLSGIASIAFLGIFLVLLSMHRVLNKIESKTKQ